MDMKRLIAALTGISIMFFAGCAGDKTTKDALKNAEVLMEERPEESLEILETIDREMLTSRKEKAEFALLYSMALDKNYIDLQSDSIISPAVKYYRHHGTAEIYLTFYIGDQTRTYVKSIPFKEAFYVSRVDQIREENWLGANMYRHYYIEKSWLVPKWIEANYSLVTWDLSTYPKGFLVKAEEYDKGAERTQTFSQEFSYATNFKTTGEVSGSNKDSGTEVNLKLGWEYGSSTEKKESSSFTEKYSENTDFLGSQWVYYHNDIILGYSSEKVIVKTYTTGSIDFYWCPLKLSDNIKN